MNAAKQPADETEIRHIVDSWARDLATRDIVSMARHDAPDFDAFGMDPWFASWPGSDGREMRSLTIVADGVAYCHCLNRIRSGTWVRAVVGLRKLDGTWQITREHITGSEALRKTTEVRV